MKHKRKRGEDGTERHAAAWCPALYATWQWIDLMAHDMDQDDGGQVLNASSLLPRSGIGEEIFKWHFHNSQNCNLDLLCFQWWISKQL
jgi:hypothetical protein